MDKLELKHLAPYLPYDVRFKDLTNNSELTLTPTTLETLTWEQWNIKPILRPLSDLSKTGEDLINEHSINQMIEKEFGLDYGIFSHYKGKIDFELDGDSTLRYDSNKTLSFDVTEAVREELLKGHYDVFNLIPNDLAIDINTLQ